MSSIIRIRKELYRRIFFLPIDLQCYFLFKNKYRNKDLKRIYFYHTRKTGGSSINFAFLNLAGDPLKLNKRLSRDLRIIENNLIFVGHKKMLLERGNYFYGFSHIPYHAIKIPNNTFTFTIIRNPIGRIISHYNMLLEYKSKNIKHPCREKEEEWLGAGFDNFIKNIPKIHLMRQIYMFSKSFDINEAYNNIINLSYFFLFNNYERGVGGLSKRLDLELESYHRGKNRYKFNISIDQLQKLRYLMKPELYLYEKLKQTLRDCV